MAELFPLILIIVAPLSVHAGVFTSLFGVFNEAEAETPAVVTTDSPSDVKLLSSRLNPDTKAALGGGDVIVDEGALVSNGPFGADTFADESLSAGEISVYVVREGDSLSQIAEMFGVTTNTILWANDISKATAIQPGDSLVILPIVGVRHVIKSGDTLSTIAKKYEADAEEILSYNQLSSADELIVGETIIIPGGNMHQAAPKRTTKTTTVAPTKTVGTAVSSAGFSHPLPGSVRTQGIHGYNAVDLAAPVGTPIRAAADGEVIVARSGGWNGGYGNYVVVKHSNGAQTLYAHMSSNTVGVGATVGAGEVVGYVGMTGRSTGAHLHFEVRGAANPF
ncbi:MAG: M23 family metallopeptidase [Candidatus Paceibacterota bacterium]